MAISMDYWREFFHNSNGDIFETIEAAITLAAFDCPEEFKIRRDSIAQTLFSSRIMNCSGSNKQAFAVEHVNGNSSNESSKVINCSRTDDNGGIDRHYASYYSYGDTEAVSNELEQELQTVGEVLIIKEIVDNSPDESALVLCDSLRRLQLMPIYVETLKATDIAYSVNVLRKHSSKDVRDIAITLIELWKDIADEWKNATTKDMTDEWKNDTTKDMADEWKNDTTKIAEDTPGSSNPYVVTSVRRFREDTRGSSNPYVIVEEGGLPAPPLDDLEKFFDYLENYGNMGANENLTDNRKPELMSFRYGIPKPTVVKPCKHAVAGCCFQKGTKRHEQKPTVVKACKQSVTGCCFQKSTKRHEQKPTVVKPSKPAVNFSPTGRQMKPNGDHNLHSLQKPPLSVKPAVPRHHKQRSIPWTGKLLKTSLEPQRGKFNTLSTSGKCEETANNTSDGAT